MVGIGVLVITGLVVYFGLVREGPVELPVSVEVAPTAPAAKTASGRSSLDVLESLINLPAFAKLKQFGRWPLPIEPVGNPEPFKAAKQSAGGEGTQP